jgi:malonyl-CoA O-methyltransferase
MMTLSTEICNAFNQHAHSYEKAALVQNEIGLRLFERLDYLKIMPRYVLDLGSGTGLFSKALKQRYPDAVIIGLDLAFAMLTETKKKQGWRHKWPLVNGSMTALPFDDGVFDLVFANQVIHWSESLSLVFSELYRVMRVGGCFMFSTLGPDTFTELTKAFAVADNYAHCNTFQDMHEVGDCLKKLQFQDPVVDMEKITVHYGELSKLLLSLKAQGVRNTNTARNRGLTGRHSWQVFEQAYQQYRTEEGKYPLTYEAIYGHAWKGETCAPINPHETRILVSEIRRK